MADGGFDPSSGGVASGGLNIAYRPIKSVKWNGWCKYADVISVLVD